MEAAATVFDTKLSPPLSRSASFYCHFRPVSVTKDTLFFSNCSLISSSNRSNFQSTCTRAIERSDHGNYEGRAVDKVLDVANVSAFTNLLPFSFPFSSFGDCQSNSSVSRTQVVLVEI